MTDAGFNGLAGAGPPSTGPTTNPVSIAQGGTGQATASAAFAALLAGSTVGISNGGTGQTTANAALAALTALASGQVELLALLDAITAGNPSTTADILLVLKHITNGNAGAGFGAGIAADLQNASAALKRVMTDVTSLTTATGGAEVARRDFSTMIGGTLTPVAGMGAISALPALFVGNPASAIGFDVSGSDLEVRLAATLYWTFDHASGVRSAFRIQENQGAAVASASTLTLGTGGNYFHITGTTAIDFITTTGWQNGSRVDLYFEGALTLNHNTGSPPANTKPLRLVGSTNASVAAGSKLTVRFDSTLSQWVELGRSGA